MHCICLVCRHGSCRKRPVLVGFLKTLVSIWRALLRCSISRKGSRLLLFVSMVNFTDEWQLLRIWRKVAADVVSGIIVSIRAVNASFVKWSHFSFMNYGFFNGSREVISKQWLEWITHGDAIGLLNLSIELKLLNFGECSEKNLQG